LGGNILHWAAGLVKLVEVLIEKHGVDITAVDASGKNILCWATRHAQVDVVRFLLDRCRSQGLLQEKSLMLPGQRSPLVYDIISSPEQDDPEAQVRMAELLIRENGATLMQPGTDMAIVPVHSAAANCSPALINFFMEEYGTPVDKTDSRGHTALHLACLARPENEPHMLSTVKFLVEEKGADVSMRKFKHDTAADIALAKGRYFIHNYLQKKEQQYVESRRLAHENAQLQAQQYAEMRRVAEEKEQLEEQHRVEMKRVAHDKALESLLAELEIEEEAAAATAKKAPKKGKKTAGFSRQQYSEREEVKLNWKHTKLKKGFIFLLFFTFPTLTLVPIVITCNENCTNPALPFFSPSFLLIRPSFAPR
jgi:hypothetical protein